MYRLKTTLSLVLCGVLACAYEASGGTTTLTPGQFAQLLQPSPNASASSLIIGANDEVQLTAGLFSSATQSIGQGQAWRISGLGSNSSLDLKLYLSFRGSAFILQDGRAHSGCFMLD